MLANPEYEWERQPEIQVWRKHTKDGQANVNLESYGPTQSVSLFEGALRNNEVFSELFFRLMNVRQIRIYALKYSRNSMLLSLGFV